MNGAIGINSTVANGAAARKTATDTATTTSASRRSRAEGGIKDRNTPETVRPAVTSSAMPAPQRAADSLAAAESLAWKRGPRVNAIRDATAPANTEEVRLPTRHSVAA